MLGAFGREGPISATFWPDPRVTQPVSGIEASVRPPSRSRGHFFPLVSLKPLRPGTGEHDGENPMLKNDRSAD